MDTKRVLILTYYWPPSGGAGVQRWLKFCRYLPQYGVEPVVITVDPKVASYPLLDESLLAEVPKDMQVIHTRSFEPLALLGRIVGKKQVPHAGFSNVDTRSLLQRVLRFIRGNFFVPDARVGWNRYAYKAARKLIEQKSFDAIVTTGPPHSTHLVGLRLKKKLGIKWLADFRDPWTDIYYYNQLMHLPFVKQYDAKLERKVLAAADEVVTNCPSNRLLLSGKLHKDCIGKFTSVTNGFDEDDFVDDVPRPDIFTLTYVGTISERYEPDVVFAALQHLVKKGINLRFRVVGSIAPSLIELVKQRSLDAYFELIDYVPHHEAIKYMQHSSMLLYIFPKTNNDGGIAGKLFEYLATGVPILALGPKEGDSAMILAETNAGKMFERSEEEGIKAYLSDIVNGGSILQASASIDKFSRRKLTEAISNLLIS